MTFSLYEVPLSPNLQTLKVALVSTQYQLTFVWNQYAACWMMDMGDGNGNAVISGMPVVTGADMLAQYAYLQIAGILIAQTDSNADGVPTLANLGITGHVYFIVGM